MVSGDIPTPRSINPAIPDAVEAILSRALQRDSARRFPSAAAMGEACEHVLYDKGYGPTNLTLKHYLASIFGEGFVGDGKDPIEHEPTLVPLQDEMLGGEPFDDGVSTRRPSHLERVIVRGMTPRPGGGARTPASGVRNPKK